MDSQMLQLPTQDPHIGKPQSKGSELPSMADNNGF